MRATENQTKWFKIGMVKHLSFIGKDVICYARGCHANFLDLHSGKEHSFTANFRSGNGDGIATITGHRTISAFAYAENCKNPVCFIKSYPSFEIIARITNGPPEGYLKMTFSETSLLVILGDKPTFSINVWNWRTQEKFAQIKSEIILERQIIRCSWGKPINMVQLGFDTHKLSYWDIYTCCKQSFLANHAVEVPKSKGIAPFTDVLWTTEGGLFISDRKGSIYTVDNEFAIEQVIEVSHEGKFSPALTWYKGGLAVSGPDLSIRHYKKSGTWSCDWTMSLDFGIVYLISNRSDHLVGIDENGELVKISNTDGVVLLKPDDGRIEDFCLVYPVGEFIVARKGSSALNVYSVETGQLVMTTRLSLSRPVLSMATNPCFPYVALGSPDGNIDLVSLYNKEKLSVMASFPLCASPVQKIEFYEQGRVLVAACLERGELFIIEGFPGSQMKIVSRVSTQCQIVDFMVAASRNCYRLFVLPVTSTCLAGNKVVRYCVLDEGGVNVKEYFFESKTTLYHRLLPKRGPDRDRIFYALPYKSRRIHVVETRRGASRFVRALGL